MTTVSSLSSAAIQSQIATDESRLNAPITALNTQATTDKADISAWGAIKGKVSSLSSALAGISDLATLNSRGATSTSSSIATATVTNSAAVGTYNLTNVTLAKAQIIYSGIVASGAKLGASAGSLTFVQNGQTKSVHVGSGSLTASGVAKAINLAADGVEASVVKTEGGGRLVLQSSATGSSKAFDVTGTGGLSAFSYKASKGSGTFTSTSTAKNAAFDINGIPISNSTNTITDAVTGLTINLAGSSTATTKTGTNGSTTTTYSGSTSIRVSNTPTGLTTAFSAVASTLNAAIAGIATEVKYTPATKSASGSGSTSAKAGPLIGNFTATNLESQLLQAVSGAEASGLSANSIGLKVSSAGTISFTNSTFQSAYASNPTAVDKLVTNIYTTLKNITTGALGSANSSSGGTLGTQVTSLNSDITGITSQVAAITKANNEALQILVSEYSAAESAAQNASITETYLGLFLNSSSGSSN
jgi:flagellar hook-associated protein 2